MSLQILITIPDYLLEPIQQLEKFLDIVDPPHKRGRPRKTSNHDFATKVYFHNYLGKAWSS